MADLTREQLEAELTRLNTQLSTGVVRVQGGDRSKQYDLSEVRRRRDEIRGQIADMSRSGTVRQVRVFSTRGY